MYYRYKLTFRGFLKASQKNRPMSAKLLTCGHRSTSCNTFERDVKNWHVSALKSAPSACHEPNA